MSMSSDGLADGWANGLKAPSVHYEQGPILQNSISAEKSSDNFSPSNFGQISTQKNNVFECT
jgi:hypothetical protein